METQTSFSPGEDTNVSGNKLEVLERGKEGATFQPLTAEAENSIIVRARKELGEVKGLKTLLTEQIHSNDVVTFDPVEQWLHNLPAWDGCDRVAELFSRLPGISAEQVYWLSLWFRSAVAHWLKLDDIHGNESVPTLIGDQGCGKTVFCRRLLPKHLREYFLDHLNLSNRFDRDMAFSNNLLVVLDELDQIKANQQAALKQSLSKNTVNGRPIFGRAQMDRHRYASFMATTNNPRPLNDPTGSRRFICVRIPNGALIDNEKPIDYEQLYAQLVDEVEQRRLRWWFTANETEAIQKANLPYQHVYSMTEMVSVCFWLPRLGEKVAPMTIAQIMETMQEQFPELDMAPRMKAQVGATMKRLGFEQRRRSDGNCYLAVAREVA
ncbi:MAG: DUF3874 domain-containing protein [Bacteroidaceae bacterium]|nr:DUF3874 domain-containing protein [Bacteroidaceae bacterium]